MRNRRDAEENGTPIDAGILLCLRECDGKFLWQALHRKHKLGRPVDWPLQGLVSTPIVEGNRIYYVSNCGELICADVNGFHDGKNDGVQDEELRTRDDADIIWRLDMIKELGVQPHCISACSPLIVDDWIFACTSNGVDESHENIPAPLAPSFIKVDKRNGKVLWQDNSPSVRWAKRPANTPRKQAFLHMADRAQILYHGQWSNPAAARVAGEWQIVFPGGDGWIRSYTIDGKLLWKFDCNPKDARVDLSGRGARSDFVGAPVIYKERVYIGMGQDPEHETGEGHLWCIDMKGRGDVSPELVVNNAVWPPMTKRNPKSAAVWHYGGLLANAEAKKVGRRYRFGRTLSTCAIADDILYAVEISGYLHCLDANNGKIHWVHDCRSPIWSSPLIADGKVYLGDDQGDFRVFAHGKEKKLLRMNVADGPIQTPAVAANGVLFFTDGYKLRAIVKK